ncbi:MAG: DUF6502 family protein [Silicimonas sp.]|nr:DUF6502 family protein [Silicimonas sp.]
MLSETFTRIFLPLARLAIRHGLGFRDLVDPLKRAFLLAAEESSDTPTDSRLAVLSGLQRRDIARLRDAAEDLESVSVPARLAAAWRRSGIDILPVKGPAPSFEALARSISQDVHPRTLLDLLRAAGSVEEDTNGLRLTTAAYLPSQGSAAQLTYLADNLGDHGAAAVENVTGDGGFFDRAAHYTGLTDEGLQILTAQYRAEQMALLERLDAKAQSLPGTGPHRARFGGYDYATKDE